MIRSIQSHPTFLTWISSIYPSIHSIQFILILDIINPFHSIHSIQSILSLDIIHLSIYSSYISPNPFLTWISSIYPLIHPCQSILNLDITNLYISSNPFLTRISSINPSIHSIKFIHILNIVNIFINPIHQTSMNSIIHSMYPIPSSLNLDVINTSFLYQIPFSRARCHPSINLSFISPY